MLIIIRMGVGGRFIQPQVSRIQFLDAPVNVGDMLLS